MKKIIRSAALVALMTVSAGMAYSQGSDQQLIGQARGAAAHCLQDYRGNTIIEISESIEVTGICFVEGFLRRVTFYAGPNCIPNQPCAKFVTRPVVYVDFDCDNNIIGVTCL